MPNYFYLVFVFAASPLLLRHFQQLNSQSMYQYFPFVLAFATWGAWQAYKAEDGDEGDVFASQPKRERSLAILATCGLAVAVVLFNPWLSAVSCLLLLAALVFRYRDSFRGKFIWAVWCSLLLVVPLPFNLTDDLSQKLQQFSSVTSSQWLDVVGINHLLRGNVISIPGQQLFVDEACSGVVSLMSVIACTVMYSVWKRRHLLHAAVLIASGVLWTLVMNVLRISTIAIANSRWDWDLSTGTSHTVLGAVIFALTSVAILSMDCLLNLILAPIPIVEGLDGQRTGGMVHAWNRWFDPNSKPVAEFEDEKKPENNVVSRNEPVSGIASIVGSLALSALIVMQAAPWFRSTADTHQPGKVVEAVLDAELKLPQQLGDWQQIQADEIKRSASREHAEHSSTGVYQHPSGVRMIASIDFPFVGEWHELCVCYRKSGWRQTARDRFVDEADDSPVVAGSAIDRSRYFTASFEDQGRGRQGQLIYGHVDTENQLIIPPEDDERWGKFADRLLAKLKRRRPTNTSRTSFQLQVFTETATPATEEEKQLQAELFFDLRQWFRGAFGELLVARD